MNSVTPRHLRDMHLWIYYEIRAGDVQTLRIPCMLENTYCCALAVATGGDGNYVFGVVCPFLVSVIFQESIRVISSNLAQRFTSSQG